MHNNHILEARCELCAPKETRLKGVWTSTSNQKYKIEVKKDKKSNVVPKKGLQQKTLNKFVCASKQVSKAQIQQNFDNKLVRFISDCMVRELSRFVYRYLHQHNE